MAENTLSATEAEEAIESAEESSDLVRLLQLIQTSASHTDDDEWESPAEAALDAFYRLVKGGSSPPNNSLSILWESLTSWIECEAIVEVCLGCIVAISQSSVEETSIDTNLLVDIMQQYNDEGTIQEQACLAIEGLAKSSTVLREKLKCEEVRGELVAARDRISNERNKKYPVSAAGALGLEV